MAYVYIIQSRSNGRYYIGSTSDIDRRFKEHSQGKHHSSKRFPDPQLVFKQEFDSIEMAKKVELRLKSFKRKDFIEKIIKDGVIRKLGAHSSVVRAGDS
ncbi:MAG: GIY-YIG nuclease family protein [Candidatus Omnitrophica bacterium]|nr:GIY-YIG nuclease family protein [Candidatus Omnitrophota bacterium]